MAVRAFPGVTIDDPARCTSREQVEKVLRRMGYEPLKGAEGLFMKRPAASESLRISFYKVTDREIQEWGCCPAKPSVVHMSFIAAHPRYLFG